MKTQFGKLVTADFEDRTLTFEMGEDAVVKFGKYAIIPIKEYVKMRYVQPTIASVNIEENRNRLKSQIIERNVKKWLDEKLNFSLSQKELSELANKISKL